MCGVDMRKVVAVCGVKNSGKTTLIEKMLGVLSERGIQTAVIKHDGHDFSCDVPGTDSYRFTNAGAYGAAVYSDHRIFVHKMGTQDREQQLIAMFPEAELILLEGMKDSAYRKIEVIRRQISDVPVSNPQGRFLIVTDWGSDRFMEETADIEDIEGIVDRLLQEVGYGGNTI